MASWEDCLDETEKLPFVRVNERSQKIPNYVKILRRRTRFREDLKIEEKKFWPNNLQTGSVSCSTGKAQIPQACLFLYIFKSGRRRCPDIFYPTHPTHHSGKAL